MAASQAIVRAVVRSWYYNTGGVQKPPEKNGANPKSHMSRKKNTCNMENKFFHFIKPYLSFIDDGHLYRRPFNWLYTLMAVVNLILPLYILYTAISNDIFKTPAKFVIVFILLWLVIAFASWVGFQIWWDRKSKVISTTAEGDDFIATPVFSHFIQTFGEWAGTWIGIVGFFFALLSTIFLGDEGIYLSRQIGLIMMQSGFIFIFLMPIYGFLVIVASRFLAEMFRALSSIANNTRKSE